MEFLNVIVAGVASFAFGAVWYMTLSNPWMQAAELRPDAKGRPTRPDAQEGSSSPMPFVVGLVAMVVVAGMMRHMFASSGVTTIGGGAVAGLGVGAFFIVPWLAMNYAFALRKPQLILIDGGYAIGGCTIIGVVLNLF
jgi:Protein of unknown function (DUF1761)